MTSIFIRGGGDAWVDPTPCCEQVSRMLKTVGMRRLTVNFPMDVALGNEGVLYILCRNEEGAMVRKLTLEDEDLGSFGSLGTEDGQFRWPISILVDREENVFISDEAWSSNLQVQRRRGVSWQVGGAW